MDELLREAQKVYVRREEEIHKRQARILVAVVREGQKGPPRRPKGVPLPRKRPPRSQSDQKDLRQIKCFYCQKKGHMKKDCRKRLKDERMFKED